MHLNSSVCDREALGNNQFPQGNSLKSGQSLKMQIPKLQVVLQITKIQIFSNA